MTWDEAAIGYNAWGILTVHRDEWLNRFPLVFKSFGDYKSPLEIYITAVSEKFFGPTLFAVRLPVGLAGIGLVVVGFFLALEIASTIPMLKKHAFLYALVVMFLLAISPWELHFSMIAFESMLAAFLVGMGVLCFLKGIRKTFWMFGSGLFFSLSLYAYHSPKLVVPFLILTLLTLFRNNIRLYWKKFAIFFLSLLVVSIPILFVSIKGNANARLTGASPLFDSHQHLKPVPKVVSILFKNYIAHLDLRFLFEGKEVTYRQSNFKDGIFSPLEGVLALVAFVWVVRERKLRILLIFPLFFAIGILPASLGSDVPHANRALLGLPWMQLFGGIGVIGILKWVEKKSGVQVRTIFLMFFVLAGFLFLSIHTHNDEQAYRSHQALSQLQYGYKEAILYARSQESSVDKVYFTNAYGQAYIFILFYKAMSPIEYQGGGLANYVIANNPMNAALGTKRVLVVGTKDEIPLSAHIVKQIYYPDGTVAFRIARL